MPGASQDIADVARQLGLSDSRTALGADWDSSRQSLPRGDLFFLVPRFVSDVCRQFELPAEVVQLALAAADRIASCPALRALAWHAHFVLYELKKPMTGWPSLTAALGEQAGMFYFLVLVSGFPRMAAFHQARSIPPDIVRDSLKDVFLHLCWYRQKHGHWGLDSTIAGGWLTHHLRGEIYRLRRLQVMLRGAPKGIVVFRHRDSGAVLALAQDGGEFRRDGQLNGAGGLVETEGTWRSRLHMDEKGVVGHPIDPVLGCALQREARLPAKEWRPVLAPGGTCLDLHIPRGDALDFEECGESLRAALDFFPRYFPERPFLAFHCNSWLFDAQLEHMLPATSNILRFQREFYLFPVQSDAWSAFRFVFDLDIPYGAESLDLPRLPRDTTLRRAMLDHVGRGGRMRKAGAFILAEDLRWGCQVYRNRELRVPCDFLGARGT